MKKNTVLINISFLSFLILCMAYFIEFGLGHKPCNLCILQRIPYAAAVVLLPLSIIFYRFKKILIMVVALLFLIGSAISFYHFGIEEGFFEESFICNLDNNKITNPEELLKALEKTVISCKDVTIRFFGLSLATINTLLSLVLSGILLVNLKNEQNR